MKLLLICLDGLRVDFALPQVVATNPDFQTPDHPSDPRFSAGAPDHTVPASQVAEWGVLARTLTRLATPTEAGDAAVIPMWMTPPTDSGPGWASILTGSTHEECNVWWNEFVGHQLARRPDILSQVFFANPAARTLLAADWEGIGAPTGPGPIVQQRVDQQRTGQHTLISLPESADLAAADAEVTTRAAWVLNHEGPDASVVYLQGTDAAGHAFGADSQQYRDAIRAIDENVRHLIKAVAERHEELGESWLIAVTTDHGHKPEGGHGEDEVEVRRSFLLLHALGGTLAGTLPPVLHAPDVCPLLLRLLGIRPASWEADHEVGVVTDVSGNGPTRDLRFEW